MLMIPGTRIVYFVAAVNLMAVRGLCGKRTNGVSVIVGFTEVLSTVTEYSRVACG